MYFFLASLFFPPSFGIDKEETIKSSYALLNEKSPPPWANRELKSIIENNNNSIKRSMTCNKYTYKAQGI